jgi:hypothetical protein
VGQERRRRRRAVGPRDAVAGEDPRDAVPGEEPRLEFEPEPAPPASEDAERYRREQPPHHDRGV